jgi:hypothetical protein
MNYLRSIALGLIFGIFASSHSFADQAIGLSEKAMLQATMQKHIDDQLINGAYLHLDKKSGQVRELYPVTAHPMIMRMAKYFVLCSHFQDENSNEINVDFYIARRGNVFLVFQSLVDERTALTKLIKAGKVSRVN